MKTNTQLFVGTRPVEKLMLPIANGAHCKPLGGLWTSPYLGVAPYSPWIGWCVEESYGGNVFEAWLLDPRPGARVLSFDTEEDIARFLALPGYELVPGVWNIDYEALARQYDGMRMSAQFIARYRFNASRYHLAVYAWDVESTVWFRWVFDRVEPLGTVVFEFGDALERPA